MTITITLPPAPRAVPAFRVDPGGIRSFEVVGVRYA